MNFKSNLIVARYVDWVMDLVVLADDVDAEFLIEEVSYERAR